MRIDAFERTKFAIQELTGHFTEPGVVLRETRGINGIASGAQDLRQQFDLRALAAAINPFDGD